jgi:hypothetical protein
MPEDSKSRFSCLRGNVSIHVPLIVAQVLTGVRLDKSGMGNIGIAYAFGAGGLLAGFLSVVACSV